MNAWHPEIRTEYTPPKPGTDYTVPLEGLRVYRTLGQIGVVITHDPPVQLPLPF